MTLADELRECQRLLRMAMQDMLPTEALAGCEELRRRMQARQAVIVIRLRGDGVSWDDIARPLGISRQALQSRAERWSL